MIKNNYIIYKTYRETLLSLTAKQCFILLKQFNQKAEKEYLPEKEIANV